MSQWSQYNSGAMQTDPRYRDTCAPFMHTEGAEGNETKKPAAAQCVGSRWACLTGHPGVGYTPPAVVIQQQQQPAALVQAETGADREYRLRLQEAERQGIQLRRERKGRIDVSDEFARLQNELLASLHRE